MKLRKETLEECLYDILIDLHDRINYLEGGGCCRFTNCYTKRLIDGLKK